MRIFVLLIIIMALATIYYASNATIVYRSDTYVGGCGRDCLSIVEWNNGTGALTAEDKLGINTTKDIREVRVKYSPVNQKRIAIAENTFGELNLYVSWNGVTWYHTKNFTDLWTTTPSIHYRGFDFAFESATGDAIIVFSPTSTSTTCELSYLTVLANETNLS